MARAEPSQQLEQRHNKIMSVHLKRQIHSQSKGSEVQQPQAISVNDSAGPAYSGVQGASHPKTDQASTQYLERSESKKKDSKS